MNYCQACGVKHYPENILVAWIARTDTKKEQRGRWMDTLERHRRNVERDRRNPGNRMAGNPGDRSDPVPSLDPAVHPRLI